MAAGVTRADRLKAFLDRQLDRRWSWGVVDCTMMVADWVRLEGLRDPAASFRGRYHDADTCHALIAAEGGFMPLIGFAMDECGFDRTQAPATGDVGLVNAPFKLSDRMPVVGTISAIRSGDRWVVRTLRGLQWWTFPTVTAWRI